MVKLGNFIHGEFKEQLGPLKEIAGLDKNRGGVPFPTSPS